MKRITTTVDPGVYRRLDEIARQEGVPTARLVREAMERYVTDREAEMAPVALPDWVGMLEGGDGRPWAERDEALLEEGWAADLEGEVTAAPPTAEGASGQPVVSRHRGTLRRRSP